MVTETASPYLQTIAPVSDKRTTGRSIKNRIPETLFAYGGGMVARPSATAHYLVPNLEMGLQSIDLAYDFERTTTRQRNVHLQFDKDRGEILVGIVVPTEAADQALLELQQAWRNVWDLPALFDAVLKAISDAALAVGKAVADSIEIMPTAVGATAQAMTAALRESAGRSTVYDDLPAWPVDAPVALAPLREDAPVALVASRIAGLTGLSDRELGQLFPGQVSREHFHRWRSGKSDNPTTANRRRLWFLLRLFERLAQGSVSVPDWIRNPTGVDDLTAVELLRLGRFDEVERLAAQVIVRPERKEIISPEGRPIFLEHGPASFAPRTDEPKVDLVFEEDDWVETENDLEDDTDNE